jgi:hypothetical protein
MKRFVEDAERQRYLMRRAEELDVQGTFERHRGTDRLFLWLLLAQWAFAIILALTVSPNAWEGKARTVHLHVQIAIVFGGVINALPIALILARPGWAGTRFCTRLTGSCSSAAGSLRRAATWAKTRASEASSTS